MKEEEEDLLVMVEAADKVPAYNLTECRNNASPAPLSSSALSYPELKM